MGTRNAVRCGWLPVSVTVVIALSACTGGGTTPTASEPAAGGESQASGGTDEPVTLSIAANAVAGGKNEAEALWITDYVIPTFQQMMADEGRDVTVEFVGRGVDDEDYKAQLALDLSTGGGDDVLSIDGIWVGEFADAGYISPLTEVVGAEVDEWEGWGQVPEAVQANMSYNDERYGIPAGTDGRVLFFNKEHLAHAGLPEDWQPTSWDEILEAARALKTAMPDVVPLQINAGTTMGEATTMQGILPLLVGTGARVYDAEGGTWLGDTPELRSVLEFYATTYGEEALGNAELQLRQDGRDRSFQDFAAGSIAILGESDYFWRSVVNPDGGIAPMENRDEVVGWAMIPAMEPGGGIEGQDFVSMSGGGGRVLNPNTEHPAEAWELLAFMNSYDATLEFVAGQARITQREDVNTEILADDAMLSFIADEVLPLTAYRPGLAVYPQVSVALQEATDVILSGGSVDEAAQAYQAAVEDLVGAESVESGG